MSQGNRVPIVAPKGSKLDSDDFRLDDRPVDLDKAKVEGLIDTAVRADKPIEDLARTESFYKDILEVQFHEPANENESPFVEARVNDDVFICRRGDQARIKRNVLEVIARSKVLRVRTERRVESDGTEAMVPKISYSPCYPFSVVHDPAGKPGIEWLKKTLAEAA